MNDSTPVLDGANGGAEHTRRRAEDQRELAEGERAAAEDERAYADRRREDHEEGRQIAEEIRVTADAEARALRAALERTVASTRADAEEATAGAARVRRDLEAIARASTQHREIHAERRRSMRAMRAAMEATSSGPEVRDAAKETTANAPT